LRIWVNDVQVAALEKKKHEDEISGEIKTAHLNYLGSQDTFYVGNLKSVGRVEQHDYLLYLAINDIHHTKKSDVIINKWDL
jgi:hypothetical protein